VTTERQQYDPLLFASTAPYYARFRPGPPQELVDYLASLLALGPWSRVLDLGCGTGQVALMLAPVVGEVVAMDPDEDMLNECRRLAGELGTSNVNVVKGSSWDLRPELGRFNLVTMAQAFHWMDRPAVLAAINPLVCAGGAVAIIDSLQPSASPGPTFFEPTRITADLAREFLGPARRAGSGTYHHPEERHQAIIARSAFSDFRMLEFPVRRKWDVESLVGVTYTYSWASRAQLGDRVDEFERILRDRLNALDPSGEFVQEGPAELILAFRPGEAPAS
jgi:ubiquinone/menaquinone biosynthesis C-methylase UbiE